MRSPVENDNRPLVGISACLAGQRVRYDGQDKFNSMVAEQIAPYCRLLAFCPEAVAGLGIPRPPVNLVQTANGIRVLGREQPERDVTARLQTVSDIVANVQVHLCGFVLQSRSPSCGFRTTPVLDTDGRVIDPQGSGILASTLHARFPGMPLINDCELEPERITLFLQQVRDYRNRQQRAPF